MSRLNPLSPFRSLPVLQARRWKIAPWGGVAIAGLVGLTVPVIQSFGNPPAVAQATPSSPMTVRSDIQEANSKTGVVTARGNVQVYYPAKNLQATATQAQYYSRERRLVLSGNVYVLQNGNSMRAETMTYLIDEGRFVANPDANQQVESIYLVEESKNSPSGDAQSELTPSNEEALPTLPPLANPPAPN